MRSEPIYDLAGIGIGPFNLSLAALCDDATDLSAIFLEQRSSFLWHEGMMIPGTTLQVPFLADLVTLANPSSRFTYLKYLREQNRLLQFAIHESNYITRSEYNRYCNWVAAQLNTLRFNTYVRQIVFNLKNNLFEIEIYDTKQRTKGILLARRLVIGSGSTPYIPAGLCDQKKENVFHSSEYLHHKDTLTKLKEITVVGSGQSAAEIIYDLLQSVDLSSTTINWITRADRFYAMETSKLNYEMTSPDYIDFFHSLAPNKKSALLSQQFSLYKGINYQLIDAIYDKLYQLSSEYQCYSINIHTHSKLEAIERTLSSRYILNFYHCAKDKSYQINSDSVILATGYHSVIPKFLSSLVDHLRFDEHGNFIVNRNYSIDKDNKIFVQNMEMHSHGFNAPDLGLGAHRNAVIINSILEKEIYPIDRGTTFQTF